MRQGSPRRPLPVWIVMFPDVQALDVTGPLEVFALANRLSPGRAPRYELSVLAHIVEGLRARMRARMERDEAAALGRSA
jgi:transcriptional regulator GlxA family with amidase domain